MLRIHLTADDLARVRLASRPAPMLELNVALMELVRPHSSPRLEASRLRRLRALPPASAPLGDIVPGPYAPAFLDVVDHDWTTGWQRIRSTPVDDVSSELRSAYAYAPGPPPAWIRALARGDRDAWGVFGSAQRATFDALLQPVWEQVENRHAAEFTRHAVVTAADGVGASLRNLLPGSEFRDGVWEIGAGAGADVHPDGRGVMLLPSFHRAGGPLVMDLPGRDVVVTYPAGSLSDTTTPTAADPLTRVLGPTRTALLRLLTEPRSTGALARELGVSAPTVSEHTGALRDAGLITSTRSGRAMLHTRTTLGTLLLGPRQ